MGIDVAVDRTLCIGSENCTRYAPASFETDSEGLAVFKGSGHDPDEAVRVAVAACPVGALTVTAE